jgi:sRNA-binding protein
MASYPGVIVEKWEPHKVLRRGILEDILAAHPDIDQALVRCFVRLYTQRRQYQVAMLEPGAQRHDLAGNPVEVVNDRSRKHAAKLLEYLDSQELKAVSASKARIAAIRAERETPIVAAVEAPLPARRLGLADLRAAAQQRRSDKAHELSRR